MLVTCPASRYLHVTFAMVYGGSYLVFNVPFQQKYFAIRDERSAVESYAYPV